MKINRTVDRTIAMLEIISNHPNGLTLNEISDAMQIPISSAFDILHTLIDNDMIQKLHPKSKIYVLGVKSFMIGSKYVSVRDIM
ncbi:MAG: hypothetical protein ATN33_04845 [Epulopiscium sp. Nele67-Bin001]|nr:MAG: hypothetical protein BEN18_06440 [Epulopiscium sp. Nuni2H_MBin001]OON94135.1 MAG: hypothetical protein ATN33_04845 [Epulopiscium sp. Nele67-Bin001]